MSTDHAKQLADTIAAAIAPAAPIEPEKEIGADKDKPPASDKKKPRVYPPPVPADQPRTDDAMPPGPLT